MSLIEDPATRAMSRSRCLHACARYWTGACRQ
jgi:hypothetical protein